MPDEGLQSYAGGPLQAGLGASKAAKLPQTVFDELSDKVNSYTGEVVNTTRSLCGKNDRILGPEPPSDRKENIIDNPSEACGIAKVKLSMDVLESAIKDMQIQVGRMANYAGD